MMPVQLLLALAARYMHMAGICHHDVIAMIRRLVVDGFVFAHQLGCNVDSYLTEGGVARGHMVPRPRHSQGSLQRKSESAV